VSGAASKNNGGEIPMRQTVVQRVADLAHHRNIKDVERGPRESDPGDAIVDLEFEVLEFFRHAM